MGHMINLFPPAVDLFETVGIRDSDLSSSDATVIDSSNDEPDTLQLHRPLSASIMDKELELIGTLLSSQFGLYTVFNTFEYTGSILAITNGNDNTTLLDVSLEASLNTNILRISLRGLDFAFNLPTASLVSPFQAIGLKLRESVLIVTLNCTIVDFDILRNKSDPITLSNGRVRIFGEDAIVSFKYPSLLAHCSVGIPARLYLFLPYL
jgi:hypothetical protein